MKELKNFVMVSSLLFTLSVCSSADKKNDAPPAKPSAKDTPVSRTEPSSPQPEPAAFSPEKTAPAPAKPATRENNNSLGLVGVSSGIDSSTIVPNAKPGQCFSKVIIPADYKEVVEQYIKKPASERTETVPPQYELIQEKILVRPATVRYEEIPAVYEVVEEKVLVKPASKKVIELPPVYETVEERVVDKEGYTVWKKSEDSNLLCLIEVPPVYKTIQKQVLKVPASKTEEVVPEEYSIIKRQIEKIPPSTRKVDVPAEYQTVAVKKLIEPEKQIRIPVPAEFENITRTVMVREAATEWRRVLCENNATPSKISKIQNALKTSGFDPGRTDGLADTNTFNALNSYQKSKGLPQDPDKYINLESVKSLGVETD
ncbi:MAG TPA: hypothetical protein PKK94_18420 [Leptospiraceae bacterium]|nr:hypothetical protein [Leptospiraceae bacterium]HNO24958.1 hypothetical protein [Leptospiraceae bacterium]